MAKKEATEKAKQETVEKVKKPIYKKWWFWVIVVLLVFGLFGMGGNKDEEKATAENEDTVTYELVGGEVGEYGTVITLNKDTDMPVDKYMYKLPAGDYTVTTTNQKVSAFYVAKDEIGQEEGNTEYPEILVPVTEEYMLTAGDDDLNGHAQKEVTISIKSDESIVLPTETDYITVTKID